MSTRELVASTLSSARYALEQGACYGHVFDVRLPHARYPQGCAVRVRVAVDPDRVVCRALNTNWNGDVFTEATRSLFAFTTSQMPGWTARVNASGTGEGRVFWTEMSYRPRRLVEGNVTYASILHAVASAKAACAGGRSFRQDSNDRWQSAEMDNGTYPVTWRVMGQHGQVAIRVRGKARNGDAFRGVTRWVFDYICQRNSDCKRLSTSLSLVPLTDTLRLDVPIGPTF